MVHKIVPADPARLLIIRQKDLLVRSPDKFLVSLPDIFVGNRNIVLVPIAIKCLFVLKQFKNIRHDVFSFA
jgi:hypothetical protein